MALRWEISRINKAPTEGSLSNVCKEMEWVVSEDDSEKNKYAAYRLGVVTLSSADSDSFIEFDDLTRDNCISWVKSILGTTEVTAIETSVNNKIAAEEAGTSTVGFPWS